MQVQRTSQLPRDQSPQDTLVQVPLTSRTMIIGAGLLPNVQWVTPPQWQEEGQHPSSEGEEIIPHPKVAIAPQHGRAHSLQERDIGIAARQGAQVLAPTSR
ncbi:MAG: hypothetical protein L6R38_006422, partial [Xanthoria sp. 2 TBL-2021]